MFDTQMLKYVSTNICQMHGEQKNYKTTYQGELVQWASQSSDLKEALKQSWYWWRQLRQPEAEEIWL